MRVTGTDSTAIDDVKCHLFREFEMKDLGALFGNFMVLRLLLLLKGIFWGCLSMLLIFYRAGLIDNNTVDTPLELHAKFSPSNGVPLEDPTEYCEMVGYLYILR